VTTMETAIVTGAGSGIGRATAMRLASSGYRVVAADIDAGRLQNLVAEADHLAANLHPRVVDLAQPQDVDAVVEHATTLGNFRVLCNVAGIIDAMAPVHEIDDAQWDRVLAVNLSAPFRLCRRAIPEFLATGGGAIVNVSSLAGLKGGAAGAAYTASKHGLIGLTRSVAWMYAEQGIRCNVVCPGGVTTAIGQSMTLSEFGTARLRPGLGMEIRRADPDEIAAVIAYLVSKDASMVNGAVMVADAGWTAG
jgi:NAD(P)-dependent dehydrogenase (short-subunit alcohol dehydrogenase family)